MGAMNRVFLMGNLTRDPQVRQTPAGTAVADLGLAVNEKYRSKTGEAAESTVFVDIVAWGKQAEACRQYLTKGSEVIVEGKLQFEQWQTPEGQRRSRLRVRAVRVQFVGRPRNGAAPASDDGNEEDAVAVGEEAAV
jgi:single-strand DNA-binding protein